MKYINWKRGLLITFATAAITLIGEVATDLTNGLIKEKMPDSDSKESTNNNEES